jgi:hypothetical protein
MRRSPEIHLTVLVVMALSVTACRNERRDCVDSTGHLLPDSRCQAGSTGARYWYGGSSGGHIGDNVVGGSSVSRGGFGGTGGSGDADAGE